MTEATTDPTAEWDVSTHGPAPIGPPDPATGEQATDLGYDVVGDPVTPLSQQPTSPLNELPQEQPVPPTTNDGDERVDGATPDPDAPTVTPLPEGLDEGDREAFEASLAEGHSTEEAAAFAVSVRDKQ